MTRLTEVPEDGPCSRCGGEGCAACDARPEQVRVNVADLRVLRNSGPETNLLSDAELHVWKNAVGRLVAAIPEPEWEPTADMREKMFKAYGWWDDPNGVTDSNVQHLVHRLKAMHREGLL